MFEQYKYVVNASDYDSFPLKWNEIFGNDNPIVIEIGFGHGEFTRELAIKHPDKNFVGFETSITSISKIQRRLYNDNIENVRILTTDGRFGIRNLFQDNSVEKVIVNFPCPWSKEKHFHRRITVPEFFDSLKMVLTENGEFELATDVGPYAEDAYDMAEEMEFEVSDILLNEDREVKTRFEKKWIKYGRDIYTLRIKKREYQKAERMLKEEEPMPHASVKKEKADISKIFSNLNKPFKSESEKQICIFKGAFKDESSSHYLLKAIAVDGEFEQHFFINIFERENDWVVKLDSVSNPYRTPAVKFSVNEVARLIAE